MTLASNLLQLIFSLLVGVASLLGALFIIGFLLVEPRNEFDDDDHDNDFATFMGPSKDHFAHLKYKDYMIFENYSCV